MIIESQLGAAEIRKRRCAFGDAVAAGHAIHAIYIGQCYASEARIYSFLDKLVWVRIAAQAVDRLKEKLRHLTRRTRHGTLDEILEKINRQVIGWMGYFRLADTPSVFHELDEWLRRRLRQLVWKRWKRGKTRWRELVKLGVSPLMAWLGARGTSPWRMAKSPVVHMALTNAYWRNQGLTSMVERYRQLRSA